MCAVFKCFNCHVKWPILAPLTFWTSKLSLLSFESNLNCLYLFYLILFDLNKITWFINANKVQNSRVLIHNIPWNSYFIVQFKIELLDIDKQHRAIGIVQIGEAVRGDCGRWVRKTRWTAMIRYKLVWGVECCERRAGGHERRVWGERQRRWCCARQIGCDYVRRRRSAAWCYYIGSRVDHGRRRARWGRRHRVVVLQIFQMHFNYFVNKKRKTRFNLFNIYNNTKKFNPVYLFEFKKKKTFFNFCSQYVEVFPIRLVIEAIRCCFF